MAQHIIPDSTRSTVYPEVFHSWRQCITVVRTASGRLIAKAQAGKVQSHWDHGLNRDDNYAAAAMKLATKFGWLTDGTCLISGGDHNQDMVFILTRPDVND